MSNDALSWAWKARVGSAKLVLVALADQGSAHSGEDWCCFPSVEYLVERTELGRATVERHLRQLDAEGWISRRRRVRADGRLGIFDYTLHRDAEVRAHLKAERAGESPALKMSGGEGADPALVLEPTSAQNDVQPALKMSALEPLLEPKGEPSDAGAREPGDEGFDRAIAAWPESGRKRTRWPKARSAWALTCQSVDAARLYAAVVACAEDPDMAKGDFGWPAFDVWLLDERFRSFLPKEACRDVTPRTAFAVAAPLSDGLALLRDEVAQVDPTAAACLDRARFGTGGAIQPSTHWAYDRLRSVADPIIRRYGFELIEPGVAIGANR